MAERSGAMACPVDGTPLVPKVEVSDARDPDHPLAAALLANEDGTFGVELASAAPGAAFFLKVGALYPGGGRATGHYFLGAEFSSHPAAGPSP